jgi:soluble lytic murein transglycosylase
MLPAPHSAAADTLLLEAQRAAFRQALGFAERGRWDRVEPHLPLLEPYVLYPELRGAWLRATLSQRSRAELESFIDAYEDHPAAREVMVRWLSVLASREDWAGYDRVYTRMGGSAGARLQCLAARAELAVGPRPDWQSRALALWLVGVSQPTECDPVFARLRALGALDETQVRARLELALESRQFGLAQYLARSLAPHDRDRVTRWQAMQRDPARALRDYPRTPEAADEWPRVRFGLLMLASRDADLAFELWRALSVAYEAEDMREVGRRVAVAGARRNTPQAAQSLALLPAPAIDEDVRYWQLRLALREDDWQTALRASAAPEAENSTALQFWRARALEALAEPERALAAYRQVAPERNLYGFMAAERSGQPRHLGHRATPANLPLQSLLESRHDFLYARELFKVGQDSRGRSAWARAIADLDEAALQQAALLAHAWGWHSRAISTAARAGLMDDLEIRYPLAWHERFRETADLSRIPSTWAIGVARNESLFVPDIASSAGAVGVMQLLPSTGREVALELNMPFQGLATLIDPDANIRLGTRYLENMLGRFDNHFVVATAAYNAGPGRVQRWLPSGPREADMWIETIPFDETRTYVHRVLASQVIFHWRLTGEDLVLQDIMPNVPGRP